MQNEIGENSVDDFPGETEPEQEKEPVKHSSLVEAAMDMGAVEIPPEFEGTKSYKDVMGDGKIKFFPELPKIEWRELVGSRFIIQAARIIDDWDSPLGTSSFPLLKIKLEDGRQVTTLGSGIAVLKQVKRLLQTKALPVRCGLKLIQSSGSQNPYYSLC